MSSWSRLEVSSDKRVRTDPRDRAMECLSAKNFLPALWPGLFDAQREVSPVGRGQSGATVKNPPHVVYTTSVATARQRLARLWSGAETDAYFGQVWQGCGPLLAHLATLAPDSNLTLDAYELCQTVGGEDVVDRINEASRQLLACGTTWSHTQALEVWKRFGVGDLTRDTVSTLRWTGCDTPREALFVAAFGWPTYSDGFASGLDAWCKAGPPRPALRTASEDANLLLAHLQAEGFVVPTPGRDTKWLLRYLELVAKHRTLEALRECLAVAVTGGTATVAEMSDGDLGRALAQLDEAP